MIVSPLYTNATTNIDSTIYQGIGTDNARHNPATHYFWGVFGGATITLSVSPDEVNYVPANPPVTMTAPGAINVGLNALCLKWTISGATGTTNINGVAL